MNSLHRQHLYSFWLVTVLLSLTKCWCREDMGELEFLLQTGFWGQREKSVGNQKGQGGIRKRAGWLSVSSLEAQFSITLYQVIYYSL